MFQKFNKVYVPALIFSKAVAWDVLYKIVVLKFWQDLPENTVIEPILGDFGIDILGNLTKHLWFLLVGVARFCDHRRLPVTGNLTF